MNEKTASFWRAIDAQPYFLRKVAARWRKFMGADFEAARGTFVQPTGTEAKRYPSAAVCDCFLRVVKHAPDDIVGVSDCGCIECSDVTLTPTDLEVWELNFEKLGRAVARAFGCEPREADLGAPLTRQIGLFGGSVPVVLAIRPQRHEFFQLLAQLVATLKERFIVLVPTLQCYDGPTQALLKGNKVGFFDLATWMTLLPDGTLQARRSGAELFADWASPVMKPVVESEAQRVFGFLRKLRAEPGKQKAPLHRVFELMVLEGRSAVETARRCQPRCVPSLITARIKTLEERFGMSLERLRNLAADIRDMESTVKGDRRRKRRDGAMAEAAGSDAGADEGAGEEYRYEEGENDS